MQSAAAVQSQAQTQTQTKLPEKELAEERLETFDTLKNRCLALTYIYKQQIEILKALGNDIVHMWYTDDARRLKQQNVTIDLEACQQDFSDLINAFKEMYSDLYQEIESSHSIDEMYDFLYESFLELNYFREETLNLQKKSIKQNISNTKINTNAVDESLKNTPVYKHITNTVEFYNELIKLIEPAIEEKQVTYWKYCSVTVTPKEKRVLGTAPKVIIHTRLSSISLGFTKCYNDLFEHLTEVGSKNPETKQLVESTKIKMKRVGDACQKLCLEREKIVKEQSSKGGLIPPKDTRNTFYLIYEFIAALLKTKREFEVEAKIIKEKFRQEAKLNQESEKAKEEFRLFETEQRKKYEEYKSKLDAEKNERISRKKLFKAHFKSGKVLTKQNFNKLLQNLNKCDERELSVLESILKHSEITEASIQKLLPKLGFSAEKVTSQGCKFKLGHFSATYHTEHAESATAGFVHPDFVSRLRKIFWAVGIDKELLNYYQMALQIQAKKKVNHPKGIVMQYDSKSAAAHTSTANHSNTASAAMPSNKKKNKKKKK